MLIGFRYEEGICQNTFTLLSTYFEGNSRAFFAQIQVVFQPDDGSEGERGRMLRGRGEASARAGKLGRQCIFLFWLGGEASPLAVVLVVAEALFACAFFHELLQLVEVGGVDVTWQGVMFVAERG